MHTDFYSYLPSQAISKCAALVEGYRVVIHVVKNRKTKHGDFRVHSKGNVTITINTMENPYRFLLTFLHEWAHYKVFSSYIFGKKPHGQEWKSAFREIADSFLDADIFPEPLLRPLKKHMQNAKATFASDADLMMALRKFDPPNNKKCIFELEQGAFFNSQDGLIFSKDNKRRTKFVCTCIKTKKQYLFPPFTEVSPM